MTRYVKMLSFVIGTMFLLGAGISSGASAAEFHAGSYPPPEGAEIRTIEPSVNNAFEIAGAVSDCATATYRSTSGYTGDSATVSVEPTYNECWTQIGSTVYPTHVHTNECEYRFSITATVGSGVYDGDVAVVNCPKSGGKGPIEVEVKNEQETATICTVKVNEESNGKLEKVTYKDFGSGTGRTVDVEAQVSNITYEVSGCPTGVEPGHEGKYELGSEIVPGKKPTSVHLEGEPVEAEVQAYAFPNGTEPLGAFIE